MYCHFVNCTADHCSILCVPEYSQFFDFPYVDALALRVSFLDHLVEVNDKKDGDDNISLDETPMYLKRL